MTSPESRMTDAQIADWLLMTLRMFGAAEANAHKIIGLFLDAINTESPA